MKRWVLIIAVLIAAIVALWFFRAPRTSEEHAQQTPPPPKSAHASEDKSEHRAPLPSLFVPAAKAEATKGAIVFSGRVVSRADGAGIADAEMTFAEQEASHTVNTAKDGAFTFTAPKPGTYQLAVVTAKDFLPFAPAWGESPLVLTARAGKSITDLVIYLEPEKIVAGKVLDDRERAVEGAAIRFYVPASEQMTLVSLAEHAITDPQGSFRIRAPAGTLIEAQHEGFDVAQERLTEAAQKKGQMIIHLRPKSADVERASIRGRVVIDGDTGLPNALVTAEHADRDPFKDENAWWTAKSDGEGRFVLADLLPGKYALVASASGYVSAREDAIAAGATDVVLHLRAGGGFVRGRVTSSAGDVASFAVVISKPITRLEEVPVGSRSFLDAEGRYMLGPFEPAKYLLRVAAQGFAASEPVEVEIAEGATREVDFQLKKGATLLGRALDKESSAPIAGARVELEGRDLGAGLPIEIESLVTTSADGSFSLAGIAAGLRSITVEAKGYDSAIVSGLSIADDATVGPIEVRLTKLASPDAEPKRELTGIGAALAPEKDVLVIGQVIEGGGAFEAGLVVGDRIVAIDGQPVAELDMNGAVQRIRGPEGTSIVLTVRRQNGSEQKIEVFRRKIRA